MVGPCRESWRTPGASPPPHIQLNVRGYLLSLPGKLSFPTHWGYSIKFCSKRRLPGAGGCKAQWPAPVMSSEKQKPVTLAILDKVGCPYIWLDCFEHPKAVPACAAPLPTPGLHGLGLGAAEAPLPANRTIPSTDITSQPSDWP